MARATIAMTQVIAITKDEPLSSNGPVTLLYFKLDCLLIKGRKLLPRVGPVGLRPACRKLVRLSKNTIRQVARLSRRIRAGGGNCCNLNPNLLETSFKYGQRDQLRIAGVPVGREIPGAKVWDDDVGSIIVVVATDAPLVPTQLKRVAKRVTLGLGRDGSYSGDGSGDIFIAFSTANSGAASSPRVQATEEAVINALVLGVSIE